MSVPIPGKSSWPELLGVNATLAATAIAHDRPDVAVEVLPPGSQVVPDFNPKRVRVFVDNNNLVSQVPVIGYGSRPLASQALHPPSSWF